MPKSLDRMALMVRDPVWSAQLFAHALELEVAEGA